MKKKFRIITAAFTALLIALLAITPAFAGSDAFGGEAYVTIVTGSDFQDTGTKAYDRYARVLNVMKDDGLPTPDAMLVGGDFTKLLFDYAAPGYTLIQNYFTEIYPEADAKNVICVQGNHDNTVAGFTVTGFYDMGGYCLYCINENDFPWMQNIRLPGKIEKLAADIKANIDTMTASGDMRPVIVMTHVPLHYSDRKGGKDNKYSPLIFDVLNEAGATRDVIFLFGHNHSGTYDDYIGGSVNFLAPGDVIRLPDGKGGYNEETLNFTYTNFGYIGYSGNTVSDTSTNALTLGAIRIGTKSIRFVKYSEDGLYMMKDVNRVAPVDAPVSSGLNTARDAVNDPALLIVEKAFFTDFFRFFDRIFSMFTC